MVGGDFISVFDGGAGAIGRGGGGLGLRLGLGGGGGGGGSRREIFPFAPAIEVDEGLHAAPFHYFAFEPDEIDGLIRWRRRCVSVLFFGWMMKKWEKGEGSKTRLGVEMERKMMEMLGLCSPSVRIRSRILGGMAEKKQKLCPPLLRNRYNPPPKLHAYHFVKNLPSMQR